MTIYKNIDVEIEIDDIDLADLDLQDDDIEALLCKFPIRRQIDMVCGIFQKYNRNAIDELFRQLLYTMDIDEAHNLLKDLSIEFLSREGYRQRILQLQNARANQ